VSSSPSASSPAPDAFSIFAVLVATVALSYKGIVAKLAYATGMGVDALMLLRFAVAVPLFWLGALLLVRGGSLRLTARQWGQCAITGFSFFLASYFDLTAISMIDATLSRLILFTYPVFVILLNALLSRQPPSLREAITCLVTYGGVCLAVLPKTSVSAQAPSTVGMLWALGSAVTYATYLTVSQKAMKEIGSARFTAASNTVTLGFMAAMVAAGPGFAGLALPIGGVLWAAVGGVACTVIPFLLLFEGIRRCGAVRASLLGLTGPLITAVSAWAILGETLSPQQSLGFAVTLAGVASLSVPKDAFRRLRRTA
jgi:drug/metabolite transporter (DMT)-like permease